MGTKKIRGNSCNMEVSCKPVGGGDVQSLRSSNYLKEKKSEVHPVYC